MNHVEHAQSLEEVVEIHHLVQRRHEHDAEGGVGKSSAKQRQVKHVYADVRRHDVVHHSQVAQQRYAANYAQPDKRHTHHLLQPHQRKHTSAHVAYPHRQAKPGVGDGGIMHHLLHEYFLQDMLGAKQTLNKADEQENGLHISEAAEYARVDIGVAHVHHAMHDKCKRDADAAGEIPHCVVVKPRIPVGIVEQISHLHQQRRP